MFGAGHPRGFGSKAALADGRCARAGWPRRASEQTRLRSVHRRTLKGEAVHFAMGRVAARRAQGIEPCPPERIDQLWTCRETEHDMRRTAISLFTVLDSQRASLEQMANRQVAGEATSDNRDLPMTASRRWVYRAVCLLALWCSGCGFQERADDKFGDQHFKTTVALVELYKVRHGEYPDSLKSLDFVGDWDQIALSSVAYRKVPGGYELDITSGWIGRPTLKYPAAFWHGLGIQKSNVKSD
jgi:hypothetical protein